MLGVEAFAVCLGGRWGCVKVVDAWPCFGGVFVGCRGDCAAIREMGSGIEVQGGEGAGFGTRAVERVRGGVRGAWERVGMLRLGATG